MSELDVSLSRLTALVESALLKRLVETPELAAFLELLAQLAEANARPRAGEGASLPIAARFSEALAEAKGDAGPLAEAVEALRPTLAFAQNPNYVAGPPSPAFLLNYGYAVFAGPADGPPALAVSPALAFGVLLLGPHTEYPPHRHPASEVYVPLGPAEWRLGEANWRTEPPGAVIFHAPNVLHATRTGDAPLAALYLWRGDLATHARIL